MVSQNDRPLGFIPKLSLTPFHQKFYLVASDTSKRFFRILKIDRESSEDLQVLADEAEYSAAQIKDVC